METFLPRLAVYPADLQRITGQSERTCQRLLNKIRDVFGLDKHQHVTVYQASDYLGIPVAEISHFMRRS
ncbi:hypothetical protein GCM10007415_41150 [Parapedobacter pyrenivorans]|uniref:Uncharacterized protein n=1 Tax=Parapedobacter pyrenivorans TaxID=1305674 RepID=A0A917I053_9SPHI|nr:hypothetical protein [Parapedobacter pyrenivorans]GGH00954.1 hypothetical protein GCM10007415_41150 [Parapedobacter pyrenivorans]